MTAHPALIAQGEQTKKDVIKLAQGMWMAVGFAASNVHMIEGKNSVTIIDTTETTQAAENILAEFRKITDKPIGKIILTHSHRDHISGASVFSEGRDVPIVASHLFQSDLIDVDEGRIAPNKMLMRRTFMQFGIGLRDDQRISLGVGPGDRPMQGMGAGFIAPNEIIYEDGVMDLDGVEVQLIHAPGETDDHLIVWVPEHRVLFCGDNWYHAFPNLYAIRGTAYRDFQKWADSLSLMAELKPAVLSAGHTRPVFGQEQVHEVITTTRDAILHVMQFTSDGMDKGVPLDDICATITLPEPLASKPWLQEFYGKLSWSARAFAAGTLGWYDGNPTNLASLSTKDRAQKMAALCGGADKLMDAAEKTEDAQWCLELCDHLIALGAPAHMKKAQALKMKVMEKLSQSEINATARNSYIWAAEELRKLLHDTKGES